MTNNTASAPAAPSPPAARFLENRTLVAGLYLLLALLMTYPLILHLGDSLPAGSGDIWQNYWNFWWWEKALLELHQHPYWTQYLYHPHGADLTFHTHSSFNMLVALPVTVAFGPGAAYNFCVLLALWLSGLGMHFFVRELTGDGRAAFLAGLVFAYFPQHIEQTLEHLNLFSTQFIPFTLYYFYRLCRRGGWRNIAGLGVCFALNALCSWHLGLMLILTLAPVAAAQLARRARPARTIVREAGLAALLSTAILLPAAGPMFWEMLTGPAYYRKEPVDRGIDAAYLLTPPYEHPLWRSWVSEAYADRAYQAAGFVCYLGFVPLGLALAAVWRRQPGALFWMGFSLLTLILALGAHPFWNGQLLTGVTLPFIVLQQIPLFDLLRVANRFLILTSVGLAVLAGLAWTSFRRPGQLRFAALAGLVLGEYLWMPYPMRRIEISPIYAQLREADRPGAVLDIPFHQRNRTVLNMVAQTVHNRPIAGGYLATYPPAVLDGVAADPLLAALADVPDPHRPIDRDHLLALGFDTVILHKDRAESYRQKWLARIDRLDTLGRKEALRSGGIPDQVINSLYEQLTALSGPPAFEDDEMAVFYLNRRSDQ